MSMVPPAYVTIPERTGSAGAEVVDLMRLVGRPPDEEQVFALDVMASEKSPGRWAALEVAIVEARQNGKTGGILLPMAIADLWLFNRKMVIWTAHKLDTALKTFKDLRQLVDGCPDLSRRVRRIDIGVGKEAVELMTGGRMEFKARSVSTGRGFQGDSITFDEALFLADAELGALVPTMSTVPDAQIRYGGSAGLANSTFWRSVRDRGRTGNARGLAYLEWCMKRRPCAQDRCMHEPGARGCVLDDEAGWLAANHTLGRRISYQFMRDERQMLPPEEFAREILGWWDEPAGETRVTAEQWAAATDVESVSDGKVVFGIDASWGLKSAAIVAASWSNGRVHVETVAYEPGAEWLPLRLQALKAKHRARFAMPRSSPATALLPDILALKIDPLMISETDMAAECTAIESSLTSSPATYVHPGDKLIETAIRGAGAKSYGDGGWSWTRRGSTSDIAPVVAMTSSSRGLRAQVKPPRSDADLMDSFG